MKKTLLIGMLAIVMVFCLAACGGSGSGSGDSAGKPVSQETYDELTADSSWSEMSLDEYTEYFGKEGVVDEDRTKEWGDGYKVVDWYNEDETGYIHFLFKKNDDGVFMPSSISPSFPE